MNFFMDILRFLLGHIDYAIYSLIEWVTQGIFDLAVLRTDVSLVTTVRNRLYVILGVFMLFKLSISFMNYIINPDAIFPDKPQDKPKGLGSVMGRTITMLILLILLPTIFNMVYRAQDIFLPVLPRVLLNTENESISQDTVSQQAADNSKNMSVMLLQAFFTPYYDAENDYIGRGGVPAITTLEEFRENLTTKDNAFLGFGGTYKYDYKMPFPTIVGLITLFLLVSITLDIAARVFKMLVLEMVAPVPIMSYIDPKSAKDGAFANWVKQVVSTFLELFIKLGLIYLILFFVRELKDDNLFISYGEAEARGVNPLRKLYLNVFLILGLLKFAKDAPEFIRSIFGIKGKGGDGIGKMAGSALGFITGGAAGAVGGFVSGRGLSGAITGAASGAAAGSAAAAQGKSVSGYRTGADAAMATRTGDAQAKSGIMANLQRSTAAAQSRREASKIGVNQYSMDLAKADMISKKEVATSAEYEYREIMQREAQFTEADRILGSARYNEYQNYKATKDAAYTSWQTKAAAAAKAERNYSKAKEVSKAYGLDKTAVDSYQKAMSKTSQTVESIKEGGENLFDLGATALGKDTIAERRDNRTTKTADKGGFNPDDR